MLSTVAHPIQRLGIPVDVTLLNGTFTLANPDGTAVPVTDETVRLSEPRTVGEYTRPEAPDFNFDGEEDHLSELGSFPHPEGAPADAPPLYGVWFSPPDEDKKDAQGIPLTDTIENGGEPIPPDLVRVALQEQNFDDIGLLESISFEDLTDTDLYIFRQSTGELVMEKSPFLLLDPDGALSATPDVVYGNGINGIAADGVAFFEASIPGRDNQHDFRHVWADKDSYDEELAKPENENKQYNAWQATQFVEADFRGDTDSLRVGEPLRVIVINRATGYIGSAETAVQASALQNRASTLGVTLPPLVLYPPNLKLSVERQYQVARGLTQGETRRYGIGSEGSALHSDQFVKISTDWRAADGRALPKDLPGFTGRLVSLVADQTLGESSVNHFAIAPGLNTEVIKLPNDGSAQSAGYQYLHVVGAKDIDAADFGTSDATRNRPENYVPIQVAVYDAEDSRALKQAQLEAASQTDSGEGNLEQDSSVYRWPYRPEMMYSVFDLDIKKITRTPGGEDSEAIDITDSENPTLVAGDTDLSIVQDLIASEYDPLEYFGPDSHLVYSLEGYQQQVHAGTDQTYSFSEFGHLGELNGEDFLTLNLLNSQDAGNVLLGVGLLSYFYLDTQFAALDTSEIASIYVSADETEIPLQTELIGYDNRSEDKKETVHLVWKNTGGGAFDEVRNTLQENGVAFNNFTVSTEAGATSQVSVQLASDSNAKSTIGNFITIPGKVATLDVSFDANRRAHVLGGSSTVLNVTAKDAFGNLVGDDTSVNIRVTGDALIRNADDESEQSYEAGTRSGVVRAAITGGMRPGSYSAIISAGDVSQTVSFTVYPYTITAVDAPERLQPGSTVPYTYKVTDSTGQRAPAGLPVSAFAQGLIIDQTSAQTDHNGELKIILSAATVPQTASLKLAVGRSAGLQQEVLIVGSSVGEDVKARILVGDQVGNAPIAYQRYDGQILDLPVPADAALKVRGTAGNTREMTLGTPSMPNVQPLVAYHLGGSVGGDGNDTVGADALGLHHAEIKQQNADPDASTQPLVRSFYQGRPGLSAVFNGDTSLESSLSSALFNPAALGFRLDVYLDPSNTVGSSETLFDFGSGALTLVRTGPSSVALRGESQGQSFSLPTGDVVTGWHSLSGVLEDGILRFYLDDGLIDSLNIATVDLPTPITGPATGDVTYPALKLHIGKGLRGALDNVELYNPKAQPLLAFADGSTQKLIDLGDGVQDTGESSYTTTLSIRSTGQLNAEQSGANLYNRSVMLHTSSGGRTPISLLSTDAYRGIAGTYAVTAYAADNPNTLPPIDDSGVDAVLAGNYSGINRLTRVGNFLINPAHAGWYGWSAEAFFDGLTSVASLLLPINEINAIWTQLGYLATDPSKFDGMELVINVISMATYFPVLKPLTPIVRPVKGLFSAIKKIGNPKFASALGGVMGTAFEKLYKTGSTAKLEALLPFILIAYEMRGSWEAVEVMVKGIESDDDLWGWIEYFNLPEGGWEGEGAPPALDLALAPVESQTTMFAGVGRVLDLVVPRAEAAGFKRVGGKLLANTFKKVFARMGKDISPKDYTGAVKTLSRGLIISDGLRIRKLAFNPVALGAMVRMFKQSRKNMKNFLAGKSSARIPAPLVMAIMAYLESEMRTGGKLDDEHIRTEVYKLYASAFADILAGSTLVEENEQIPDDSFSDGKKLSPSAAIFRPSAHGAIFHLAMIAYYTLLDELETIEAPRTVFLYSNEEYKDDKNVKNAARLAKRRIDIVLKNDGEGERWVELKSLQRIEGFPLAASADGFRTYGAPLKSAPMRQGTKRTYRLSTYSKQFHKDRAAAFLEHAYPGWLDKTQAGNTPVKKVSPDFKWWFQTFDVKARTTPAIKASQSVGVGTLSHKNSIKKRLTDQAHYRALNKDILLVSFGIADRNKFEDRREMGQKIDNANAAELAIDQLKRAGLLDSAVEEAIAALQ